MIRTVSAATVVLIATAAWGATTSEPSHQLTAAPQSTASGRATAPPRVPSPTHRVEHPVPKSIHTPEPIPTAGPTPTAVATSTPSPTTPISTPPPISTPSPSPSPASSFVTVCGTALCADGVRFDERGATAYGQYGNPANEVALARHADLNTLELVEFDTRYHTLSDTESSATWDRVDAFIAAAHVGGLHVILNLSEYGQSLQAAGQPPVTTDWGPYLKFIANRVNTVTGVRYADDPTIAMVELWGEIPAPNYPNPVGTTQQITDFYSRSLAEWRADAPNILVSSGGFSYINDPHSGIDWKTIMADPANAACDVEVNSTADLSVSVPGVSSYCRSLGKPWFLAAWSSCFGASRGTWDLDYWSSDAAMAAHARVMINVADGVSVPAPFGDDFWNIGDTAAVTGTCDIGPQFPLTFAALQ
jgi:hypothetical protein